ncbi:23S rRNA (uracil(1939)-C(5))-methyltransferase RlmD [soil metagenome]
MSKKYAAGDVLDVAVEKIVPRGYGLAFAEGLTIFVALAAAGDHVRVRLAELKGKTAFAEIEEILEPSKDRVVPPCPYFGTCGGCDFQQMNYSAQLAAKVAMIHDCITRIGKIELTDDIEMIASPAEFGYRLRAQWHVDPQARQIGYYQRNSRKLVDIEHCAVLVPELQQQLSRLRSEPKWDTVADKVFPIDAAAGDGCEVSIYSPELIEPTRDITVAAAGERFAFSSRAFFQGNRFLIDKLVETAIGDATGATALDLYCGVGLFTLPLARRFAAVVGVEESEGAVDFANRNAQRAGLGNIDLYAASVRDYLASGEAPRPDLILLDPPRAGTEKETIHKIIALGAAQISYVACEPSILARDLRRFVENGYQIDSITAIDLFPQTHHVETVARLSRVSA